MGKKKSKKVRVQFEKNRESKVRNNDMTRLAHDEAAEDQRASGERVRAKGAASRKRTVLVDEDNTLIVREEDCLRGRVLSTQGLQCVVVAEDGQIFRCYVRRLLKSMESDSRTVVVTGDWVRFRPAPGQEGMVVRVEPRSHLLTRRYRRDEHVIAANVEQVLIVASLIEPEIKPNLIDRYLVSAAIGGIRPMICLAKADLVQPHLVMPLMGLYAQLGYRIILASSLSRLGVEELRGELVGRETVVVGQSGVGKSSILNALEPTFHLKVSEVSTSTSKGKHTTTTSQLLALPGGGSVIDTPGIRQFDLADVGGSELAGYFLEFRPFLPFCKFPSCRHAEEEACAIKAAVAEGWISTWRYDSYVRMLYSDHGE